MCNDISAVFKSRDHEIADRHLMGDHAAAKADVVVDMEASGSEGRLEHLTIGGRYELEFARLDQGWRISKRRLVRRYVMGDPMLADQARRAGA